MCRQRCASCGTNNAATASNCLTCGQALVLSATEVRDAVVEQLRSDLRDMKGELLDKLSDLEDQTRSELQDAERRLLRRVLGLSARKTVKVTLEIKR